MRFLQAGVTFRDRHVDGERRPISYGYISYWMDARSAAIGVT